MTTAEAGDAQAELSRRQQILDTALALFRTQGFERTSLREIAERLDLSKSGLYHHFAAKDDLVSSLVEPLLEEVEAVLADTPPSLPTVQDRRRLLERYLDVILGYREVISLLGSDARVLTHPRVGERIRDINEDLHRRLAGERPHLAARVRATHALVGLQAVVVRYTEGDPEALRTESLAAAFAALGA